MANWQLYVSTRYRAYVTLKNTGNVSVALMAKLRTTFANSNSNSTAGDTGATAVLAPNAQQEVSTLLTMGGMPQANGVLGGEIWYAASPSGPWTLLGTIGSVGDAIDLNAVPVVGAVAVSARWVQE